MLRFAILELLSHKPLCGCELKKRFGGSIVFFWRAAHSQIYPELKRMEAEGLVSGDKVPHPWRPTKKVYAITEEGTRELVRWLREATGIQAVKDEMMLKCFAFDLVSPEEAARQIDHHKTLHERRLRRYREIERDLTQSTAIRSRPQTRSCSGTVSPSGTRSRSNKCTSNGAPRLSTNTRRFAPGFRGSERTSTLPGKRSKQPESEGRPRDRRNRDDVPVAPWPIARRNPRPMSRSRRGFARAIPEIRARSARKRDKIRVVLEGGFCEQPPLEMLRIIDQSCYVVDDDLLIGLRWILSDVSLDGDPLRALAEAYLEQSTYSPVQHDLRKPKERMLVERIRACQAEAAIIAAAKMCEPGLDEQVAYTRALEADGIPYFVTEFEEKMTSFDQLQMQLETFVESLLFEV